MVPEKIEQHWLHLYTELDHKWFVNFDRMLARCFRGEECTSQDDYNRLCIVDDACFVFSACASSWVRICNPIHDKLMRLYTQHELERAIFSEVDCE